MPKLKRVFDAREAYLRSRAPQVGFFSVLDEMIAEAPFEKASTKEWRNYLQPGKTIKREDVNFPLKKEELDYSGLREWLNRGGEDLIVNKDNLRGFLFTNRPQFGLWSGASPKDTAPAYRYERSINAPGAAPVDLAPPAYDDPRLRHSNATLDPSESTDMTPYEESVTGMSGIKYGSHFGDDTLSWSRTTQHKTNAGELARLIEEIQSDLHQNAAEPTQFATELDNEGNTLVPRHVTARRGYRTPEDERLIKRIGNRSNLAFDILSPEEHGKYVDARAKSPDAPFKDPGDYGSLEMKKQLLNAVRENEDYLALVRPQDQLERYSEGVNDEMTKGMEHIYGKVYPSALEKLAKRYGASMTNVDIPVKGSKNDIRPPTMVAEGYETIDDVISRVIGDGTDEEVDPEFGYQILDELQDRLPQTSHWSNKVEKLMSLLDQLEDEPTDDLVHQVAMSFGNLYDAYEYNNATKSGIETVTKNFPAVKLTPEVRDKIRRIGVPLWATAGAGVIAGQQQDEGPGMAEGGAVSAEDIQAFQDMIRPEDEGLARLSMLSRKLGRAIPGRKEETYRKNEKLWKQLLSGLASQWYGLDKKTGNVELGAQPGIVDETLALPELLSLPEVGVQLFGGKPNLTSKLAESVPEWAHRASDRTSEIGRQINEQMGIDEPHGLDENLSEAGGVMLGQIPFPVGLAGKARKAAGLGEMVGGSGLEWFLPTIHPTPGNYAAGTGFGGTLNTLMEKLSGPPKPEVAMQDLIDEVQAEDQQPDDEGYAAGGKVKAFKKFVQDSGLHPDDVPWAKKGSWLKEQGWIEPISDEETNKQLKYLQFKQARYPKGQAFAGGGKVKEAESGLMKLRKMLTEEIKGAEIDPDKQMIPAAEPSDVEAVPTELSDEQLNSLASEYGVEGGLPIEQKLKALMEKMGTMNRRDFLGHAAGLAAKKFLPELDLPSTKTLGVEKAPKVAEETLKGLNLGSPRGGRIEVSLLLEDIAHAIAEDERETLWDTEGNIERTEAPDHNDFADLTLELAPEWGENIDRGDILDEIGMHLDELGFTQEEIGKLITHFDVSDHPSFVETDSNNISHGAAYYDTHIRGPEHLLNLIDYSDRGDENARGRSLGLLKLLPRLKQSFNKGKPSAEYPAVKAQVDKLGFDTEEWEIGEESHHFNDESEYYDAE